MAKTSKKQILVDEKKVIQQLQSNAMENLDLFAKKCGFSRQKVWRIIKNLEENKSIWGYTAIIDPEYLQKKHYVLLMKRARLVARAVGHDDFDEVIVGVAFFFHRTSLASARGSQKR